VKVFTLEREQIVARELDRIFPFFERPENLALITPRDLRFRLLTPSPVPMRQGQVIDYAIRVMSVPVRWRSLISLYDPPWAFADEQLDGPYAYWHHAHEFRSLGDSTLLRDRVRYALPAWMAGPPGNRLQRLYVAPSLRRIFDYRAAMFERLFGSPAPSSQ
jgi:ligand-binding SRPBCC domain-containing protein